MAGYRSSRVVTVKCPNHHEELVSGLWAAFGLQRLVDFDIRSEEGPCQKPTRAHLILLELFLCPDKLGQSSSTGRYLDHNNSNDCLDYLLEFLYRGNITLPVQQVGKMLAFARDTNFRLLVDALERLQRESTKDKTGEKGLGVRVRTGLTDDLKVNCRESPSSDCDTRDDKEWLPPAKKTKRRSTVTATIKNTANSTVKFATADTKHKVDRDAIDPLNRTSDIVDDATGPVDTTNLNPLPCNESISRSVTNVQPSSDVVTESKNAVTTDTASTSSQDIQAPQKVVKMILKQQIGGVSIHLPPGSSDMTKRVFVLKRVMAKSVTPVPVAVSGDETTTDDGPNSIPSCSKTPARSVPTGDGLATRMSTVTLSKSSTKSKALVATLKTRLSAKSPASVVTSGLPARERNAKPATKQKPEPKSPMKPERLKKRLADRAESTVTYDCEHCSFKSRKNTSLQVHRAAHDPSIQLFDCGQCPRKFVTQELFERHQTWHSGQATVRSATTCPHCQRRFFGQTALKLHMTTHDPSIRVFRCTFCYRRFLTASSLESHMVNHDRYKCFLCDTFESTKRSSYVLHLSSAHGVNGRGEPLKLNCDQCTYTCKNRQQLKNHIVARHSGTKPYLCEICDWATARRWDLRHHINVIHKSIKKFLCDQCGYRTVTQSKLNSHKAYHTNATPFQCKICNKGYKDATSMRRHERGHDSPHDRPHVCHICNHACSRKSNLNTHLKNVHKITKSPKYLPRNKKDDAGNQSQSCDPLLKIDT